VLDDRLVRVPVLRREAGDGGADVTCRERGRGVDGAGQEPLAQRAERDEPDAEFGEGGQDLGLGVAGPQRVLGLHRGHRVHGVGAADGAGAGLGEAEVAHLARGDQPRDRPRDVLDRDLRVHAVLVVQVDRLDAEAAQRPLRGGDDVLGPAAQAHVPAALEAEPELGRDDHVVPHRGQRLAHQFLVDERAVDLGGVDEGDAAFDGAAQHADHLVPVAGVGPVALGHAHGAQADGGDLEALAECAGVHGSSLHVRWILGCGGDVRRRPGHAL